MSLNKEPHGSGEKFIEVAEAKIAASEGLFKEQHPFLRTAVRGL